MKVLKSIYLTLTLSLGLTFSMLSQPAVQFVHASPDQSIAMVDIWIDTTLIVDNLEFRSASPLVDFVGNEEFALRIMDSTSTDTIYDDSLLQGNLTSSLVNRFLIFGIYDSLSYSSYEPLEIRAIQMSDTAAQSGYIDISIFQASPDLIPVSIEETRFTNTHLTDSLGYAMLQGPYALEASDYRLLSKAQSSEEITSEVDAPLFTLGNEDSSAFIIITGFANPTINNGGALMRYQLVPRHGGVFQNLPNSRGHVKFIHNSANPALNLLDVYINGKLTIDNLAFRHGTAFVDVFSSITNHVQFTADTASNPSNPIFEDTISVLAGQDYSAILNGVSGFNFQPNRPLDLLYSTARRTAEFGQTSSVKFVHGGTDAGKINIYEPDVLMSSLSDTLDYFEQSNFIELPVNNYKIGMTRVEDDSTTFYDLALDGSNWMGQAIQIIASGFKDTLNNSNGELLSLWVADTNAGPLTPLSIALGKDELAKSFHLLTYPNPTEGLIYYSTDVPVQELTVFNVLGERLRVFHPNTIPSQVDLRAYPSGIYYLHFKTGINIQVRQIIRQ